MDRTVAAKHTDPALGEDIVEALYEALLGREPDPAGFRQKVSRFARGEASIRDLVGEFIESDEFAVRASKLLARKASQASGPRFTNDHSQYGELWLLLRRWVNAQARCGIVVDVGARGRDRSNSYDLMRHLGWRGLLVEANPALLPTIAKDFAGCDMTLVSCAISDYVGRATFTLGANDDVSSLDPTLAADWGATRGEIEVDVRRLPELLAEHAIPETFDLLSLDIEGHDIRVLNDLLATSAFRPDWIIIEASHDFRVASLEDAPFSREVRNAYAIRDATRANLILQRHYPERDVWTDICARTSTGEQRS